MAGGLSNGDQQVVVRFLTLPDDDYWAQDPADLLTAQPLDDPLRDPIAVAADLVALVREASGSGVDADVAQRLVDRIGLLTHDGTAVLAQVAAADHVVAGALAQALGEDDDRIAAVVPVTVLVRHHDAGVPWATNVIARLLDPSRPAAQRWRSIAELLDAGTTSRSLPERLRGTLESTSWGCRNPRYDPAAFSGPQPPTEAAVAARSYDDLFDRDDPRWVRARVEADALEATIACWEDEDRRAAGWLSGLSRGLDGCGVHTCCRLSLFEVELMRRGHRPRRWPELFAAVDDLPSQ